MARTPLRLSWSAMQTFLACQRKYDLTYRENLQRKPSAAHRNLLLGSAFHAGVEAALQYTFDVDYHQMSGTSTWMVERALEAAETYLTENVVQGKVVTLNGIRTQDDDYYAMVRDVTQLVRQLIRFHIPAIGLGSRYLVPSLRDVLSGKPPTFAPEPNGEPVPMSEYHFEFPLADNTILSGYIDSVLWDVEEEEYILVDWKTRGKFPHDSMALIDGQIHLYAAILNELAMHINSVKPIYKVVMWQFKTAIPEPASINKKTGKPNTGAKEYWTTWEHWVATLPRGMKAEHYEAEIRHKLKSVDEWQHPVSNMVSDISSKLALDNALAIEYAIRQALDSGVPLPAILSSNGCQWCDFSPLCTSVLRFGGTAEKLLTDLYQPRVVEIDESKEAE